MLYTLEITLYESFCCYKNNLALFKKENRYCIQNEQQLLKSHKQKLEWVEKKACPKLRNPPRIEFFSRLPNLSCFFGTLLEEIFIRSRLKKINYCNYFLRKLIGTNNFYLTSLVFETNFRRMILWFEIFTKINR